MGGNIGTSVTLNDIRAWPPASGLHPTVFYSSVSPKHSVITSQGLKFSKEVGGHSELAVCKPLPLTFILISFVGCEGKGCIIAKAGSYT